MTMKEEVVSGWALAEEILVADTYFLLCVNTLAHSQEDTEEEGLEDLSQSSKQVAEYHVNVIHWYIVRNYRQVAEYQVIVCSSRLSKDLFCNKQVGGKNSQRRETIGGEEKEF